MENYLIERVELAGWEYEQAMAEIKAEEEPTAEDWADFAKWSAEVDLRMLHEIQEVRR